ncbi:MAG: phage scaffolding protein [Ruminococcus sp.]|nr:phage scaffolding protein [Ruminococcus sp.]
MTKEELMELGLAEDQANKVLEKHTAELTAEQQKNTDLTAELDTAKASITELTDKVKTFDGVDVEGLKQSAKDWETKYNNDIAALKVDKAIEMALIGAKARDVDIVKSRIDTGIVKLDDNGKLIGLDEQLEKLKADKAFLFDVEESGEGIRIDTGLQHGSGTESVSDAQARAVMGLSVENK